MVTESRVACAGGIVIDAAGRLLLIRRATAPGAGLWSVPGGRGEPGEASDVTCVREVAEETGLAVRPLRRAGRVERPGPPGIVYDIDDYVCAVVGGELRAGDDASDVRWVTRAEFGALDAACELVPGLFEALNSWKTLPD